jgi:hypothetical protein
MHDPHKLLPVAYRAASTIVRSPVLAEEAGERAIHLLTLAMLDGHPPHHPRAWLRVVARRSACALLRSEWARTEAIADDDLASKQAPYRQPQPRAADVVPAQVHARLTLRQQQALSAALSCNTTRDAARSCGMQPRDFRRYLHSISGKARRALECNPPHDAFADDPCVQFRLAP